ncbi:MAG: TIGR02147 family protein [Pseudobdellovibrio sp.]
MEQFKNYLQQEFVRRTTKNPSYSLRAFAQHLKLNHATLSSLLSGKRPITKATIQKIATTLDLGPAVLDRFINPSNNGVGKNQNYFMIQQDAFAAMSEWYFDAILELSLIPRFNLLPEVIAKSIGITALQAKIALETLERLELLIKDEKGHYKLQHKNSVNILDSDFTSAANRKYQKSVLNKSAEALEKINRKERDHTSTIMAINKKDLKQAKELIQNFRQDLNAFLQRADAKPNEVYQLQISFFPLTHNLKDNEQE